VLDQAGPIEIAQPEIEHKRVNRRHRHVPRLELTGAGASASSRNWPVTENFKPTSNSSIVIHFTE
jgi:hypothetical protein